MLSYSAKKRTVAAEETANRRKEMEHIHAGHGRNSIPRRKFTAMSAAAVCICALASSGFCAGGNDTEIRLREAVAGRLRQPAIQYVDNSVANVFETDAADRSSKGHTPFSRNSGTIHATTEPIAAQTNNAVHTLIIFRQIYPKTETESCCLSFVQFSKPLPANVRLGFTEGKQGEVHERQYSITSHRRVGNGAL